MKRTRNILRVAFFVLAAILVVYLNRKTDDNVGTIVEFKFKMIEKIRTDSLDSKQKLNMVVNETSKFIDDSSHVREGIRYLMGLLTLWGAIELVFLILETRSPRRY